MQLSEIQEECICIVPLAAISSEGLNSYMTEADMLRKSMDWFLHDIGLRHERVKGVD